MKLSPRRACLAALAVRAAAALGADPTQDCFHVPRAVCFQGEGAGSFVVGADHVPPDLAIWYRFDKSHPVDESGQGHHLLDQERALTPAPVGPGILGKGGSLAFDGHDYRFVPHSPLLEKPSFTISLWIYLREDSVGAWRTIFKKGSDSEELLPALLLWPDQRRLQVRMSPAPQSGGAAVALNSVGVLPLRRWTHVAVSCMEGSMLRLYVNGARDGEVIVDDNSRPQSVANGELFIGRDPWRAGVKAYIDDFRWYTRAVTLDEIRALLYPRMTGMAASNFMQLGCASCHFNAAVSSCGKEGRHGTHLCSLQELLSGGFHLARAMGWLAANPEVWYSGEAADPFSASKEKLALCCADA